MEAVEIGRDGPIPCFAYGSNGTKQLRERCRNEAIVSFKACVYDQKRFFTGYSKKWGGGGVASLMKVQGAVCKGSVAYLTKEELNRLDRFEGIKEGNDPFCTDYSTNRYARVWVECDVWIKDVKQRVRAIAYIRNKTTWEGMPSKKYLNACYINIEPFWPEVDRYGRLCVFDCNKILRGEYVSPSVAKDDKVAAKENEGSKMIEAVEMTGRDVVEVSTTVQSTPQ